MNPDALRFSEHGAVRHDRAASIILSDLEGALAIGSVAKPGRRLSANPALATLLDTDQPFGLIAADLIGRSARPVRAVLFDKTPGINWSLGWHQDRTIAVQTRHDVPGFGPWSTKSGITHVEPPFSVIEAMVTLRIHLDDVPTDNAPLLIAPGSHRLGRIPESELHSVVERCGTATCLADRGDVWGYATPIIHASAASTGHAHRRVLQVDYAAIELPLPLTWLGIA